MGRRWLAAAVCAATISTGCGDEGASRAGPTEADGVRIASFDFEESRLVAELYAQVLESSGFEVVRLGAIGPREVVAPALEQGLIDLVPEYLGTASSHFGANPPDLAGLAAALAPRGLTPLDPAPAQDVNVFVVTATTAAERDLTTITDLAMSASELRIGGPVECPDRPLCLEGLRTEYGLEFAEFVPQRTLAITAEALRRGEIDIGVMFSTASEVTAGPFVVLVDDRALQPPENIVALVRTAAVDRWGAAVIDTLDSMSQLLTTNELQAMNRRIGEGETIESVANDWLSSVGLGS